MLEPRLRLANLALRHEGHFLANLEVSTRDFAVNENFLAIDATIGHDDPEAFVGEKLHDYTKLLTTLLRSFAHVLAEELS